MISVEEIRSKEFSSDKRGYNSEEVDDFLDELADQLEAMEKQLAELKSKGTPAVTAAPAPAQNAEPDDSVYFRDLQKAMRDTLINAQRIADETTKTAQAEAEETVQQANRHAEEITKAAEEKVAAAQAELDGLKNSCSEFRAAFKALVQNQLASFEEQEAQLI